MQRRLFSAGWKNCLVKRMRSKDYLTEIRRSEGLRRAILRGIEIKDAVATFFLATDLIYSENDKEYARSVSERYTPAGLTAEVKITKSVPSAEGVRKGILETLKNRFPAVAAFVAPDDVEVDLETGGGRFFIGVGEVERNQFSADGAIDVLSAELGKKFCGIWHGEFRYFEKEKGQIEREELPPEEILIAPRSFAVTDFSEIDGGEKPSRAIYIADLVKEMQGVSVCGTVTYAEERVTKSGKPYFSFTISDGTGQLRIAYFTRKATLEQVRGIKVGAGICFTGDNELFNGSLSFRARTVNAGNPPADFVPEPLPSRPVPSRYRTVFPVPVSDPVQSALFEEQGAPPAQLCERDFVVFDLETTGLNNSPVGGAMDRIIEIGAVKIRNGKICEKFSSFVACPVRLSGEIIRLTGINDEMLAGAPDIADVVADFYKFSADCALVGHNVQFDYKFIRHYGEKERYSFEQKTYDTVSFAQEMLRLSNYKLNTVADHFGFTFNHHRAYDDAFVTAKIFLALVKLKNGLPK